MTTRTDKTKALVASFKQNPKSRNIPKVPAEVLLQLGLSGINIMDHGVGRVVVSNKPHKCRACELPIETGEAYIQITYNEGLNFPASMRVHTLCYDMAVDDHVKY